jgi:hypothetical protein
MSFFHGTDSSDVYPHLGFCYTNERVAAECYGDVLYAVEIDMDDLVVRDLDLNNIDTLHYDRNAVGGAVYPGDNDESLDALEAEGVDVVCYEDEDRNGRMHWCWRLVSQKAKAACTLRAL